MVESQQIKQESGKPFKYKKKCLELICSASVRWPLGWGLYVTTPKGQIHHSSSLELLPLFNPENGELLSLAVKFNGFEMSFLMGKPNLPNAFGIFRPNKLNFLKDSSLSTISFNWHPHKSGKEVSYLHTGIYRGGDSDFRTVL